MTRHQNNVVLMSLSACDYCYEQMIPHNNWKKIPVDSYRTTLLTGSLQNFLKLNGHIENLEVQCLILKKNYINISYRFFFDLKLKMHISRLFMELNLIIKRCSTC